jgi:hypothetical protein
MIKENLLNVVHPRSRRLANLIDMNQKLIGISKELHGLVEKARVEKEALGVNLTEAQCLRTVSR